jgi:hypothetical protein
LSIFSQQPKKNGQCQVNLTKILIAEANTIEVWEEKYFVCQSIFEWKSSCLPNMFGTP